MRFLIAGVAAASIQYLERMAEETEAIAENSQGRSVQFRRARISSAEAQVRLELGYTLAVEETEEDANAVIEDRLKLAKEAYERQLAENRRLLEEKKEALLEAYLPWRELFQDRMVSAVNRYWKATSDLFPGSNQSDVQAGMSDISTTRAELDAVFDLGFN